MLEKFQKVLEQRKKELEKGLMLFDLETVQGYFEMQDVNKWLKFNAMNEKQIISADIFEEHLQNVIKKLYVPDYQLENV